MDRQLWSAALGINDGVWESWAGNVGMIRMLHMNCIYGEGMHDIPYCRGTYFSSMDARVKLLDAFVLPMNCRLLPPWLNLSSSMPSKATAPDTAIWSSILQTWKRAFDMASVQSSTAALFVIRKQEALRHHISVPLIP